MKSTALALLILACNVQAEPFDGITAKNGAEWVAQCGRPATKSNSEIRASACLSYLKGAASVLIAQVAAPDCRAILAASPPGAMFDVSLSWAKEYPSAPLQQIVNLTVKTADQAICPH